MGTQDTAPAGGAVPHYVSVDSAPKGFAVTRKPWVAPLFLATFCGASAVVISVLAAVREVYVWLLSIATGVPASAQVFQHGSIGFRPFFALLIAALALFAIGSWRQRRGMLLYGLTLYGACIFLTDITFVRIFDQGGPRPFSASGSLVTGFVGVFVLSLTFFTRYELPRSVKVHTRVPRSKRYVLVLIGTVLAAAGTTVAILQIAYAQVDSLRELGMLGGVGPGLALFFPVQFWLLFIFGTLERRRKPRQGPLLSVAFLVPAYNEEHGIAETIRSLDRAAARYAGTCHLYLVDNNSKDNTRAVAEAELAKCTGMTGVVAVCKTPGKSKALNMGLSMIKEELVVRVDADTAVAPNLLEKTIPYFWDPSVGGVGGLPLPKNPKAFLGRMRNIEVHQNIGFMRVAQNAIDAVLVLPGILSAYRRAVLEQLGGFGEGFNGEDTDITVRIGRLGYRVVTDPSIHVFSEVPETLGHMREQRLRWGRSFFHVAARNMSMLPMRQGPRGVWVLPWGMYYVARRLIVVPILLYALVTLAIDPGSLFLRQGAAIAAVLVGPQVVLVTLILVVKRQFHLVPWVPAYLGFRLFRTYIGLESTLTLPLRERRHPKPQPVTDGGPSTSRVAPSAQVATAVSVSLPPTG